MSTYQEIQERVNTDYLNRTVYADQTKRAIKSAIRHYETRRTTFNETATTLASSVGQVHVVMPSNFLILDDFRITINSEDLPLEQRSHQWIRNANMSNTQGQPTDYAIYQRRAQLHLIPDAAYVFPLHYIKQLDTLSADSDTNSWIEGAWEDVITYRAAKLMWANVVRNDTEAQKFAILEREALSTATTHLEQSRFTRIQSTSF